MRKKVVALAVAGVFAAPAAVLAQSSTVQIYGRITYEYGHIDQGAGRPSTDYADTPGGSAIGFRGEEKLGGGLSAWFQCESSVDVRGIDSDGLGFCTRNSAVGFKGGWGNLHFGRWDSPMKRALNQGSVGATETGLLGTSFVAWGGSGGSNAINKSNRQRWKRRDVGWTYYESPKFSGFQVLGAFTPGNGAVDNGSAALAGASNQKPRVMSIAGLYSMGPIDVGLGYEEHQDFGNSIPAGGQDQKDKAWGISGAYTFAGKVTVGATYLDAKYETQPGTETKRKSWTLGVEWAISGPHGVQFFYGEADDAKGSATASVGDIPAPVVGGIAQSDTGAKDWSIGYTYKFSKRTRVLLGYHVTDNDSNAFYKNGNANAPTAGGEKQEAYAFHIQHNF
jgi:predicted porin